MPVVKYTKKAEYRKLIREIERALAGSYGSAFGEIITAMRGPDDGNHKLKSDTTIPIRSAAGWHCGLMTWEEINLDKVLRANNIPWGSGHFRAHINKAVDALRLFRLTTNRWAKRRVYR